MRAPETWPRLGLGCAVLGTPPPDLSDRDAEAVIAAAIERGIRFFDVAPLYGGGLAEERLGRALAGLPRDKYILSTKTGHTRPYAQAPQGGRFDDRDYTAASTRRSVETSLERLRTDRLDLVHIHDADDHLDACLEAHAELSRMRDEGLVDGIGIGSNFAAPVAHLLARADFDAFLLAGCYTLLDQSGTELVAEACARGIGVVAGGVFNSGVLATWPQPAPTYRYAPASQDIVERTAHIAALCGRHRVPIGAAALQFALANPAIDTVLIGPRSVAELEANFAAAKHPIPTALWDELVP